MRRGIIDQTSAISAPTFMRPFLASAAAAAALLAGPAAALAQEQTFLESPAADGHVRTFGGDMAHTADPTPPVSASGADIRNVVMEFLETTAPPTHQPSGGFTPATTINPQREESSSARP